MPLRNATPLTFRPMTLTDTVDGTNQGPGAMRSTQDFIWATHTRNTLVPRPAAQFWIRLPQAPPVRGELLDVIGNTIYGMVASGDIPGHSVPFAYDIVSQEFLNIQGITADNTPVSTSPTGDWIPPTMAQIGAFKLFTHPGFSLPNAFGWLDATGLHDTATGGVGLDPRGGIWGLDLWGTMLWGGPGGGSTGVSNLSKNVLQAGWRPGMMIKDSAGLIPPDTRIVSIDPSGLKFTISQAATGFVDQGDLLTVTGGTPTSPLWAAGNESGFPLPDVPKAVTNFNGRAYFAVGPATPASDSLDPLVRTNADQVLTFDNGLDVTAFGGIPLSTTQGFVSQNLLAFQGDAAIQGISGDPALGNWQKNLLATIGTLAPNAIFEMPSGTGYIAPDGLRIIDLSGQVGDPIGANGDGLALPFMNAIYPSRMCASYNEDIVRISVTYDSSQGGAVIPTVVSSEFWYHLKLKSWSGPHSFPAALIAPVNNGPPRHGYVLFPLDQTIQGLWFSESRPSINSSYIENGKALNWTYETSLMPDNQAMFMNGINETTLMVSLPAGLQIDVSCISDQDELLDHIVVPGASAPGALPVSPSLWGTMTWGTSVWGGGAGIGTLMAQRLLPWDHEVVFKQCRMMITGPSQPQIAVGNLYMRYQITGYTITDLANVSS